VYLSDFDLQQLDEQKLTALPAERKDALLVKLLWDLKDARERLKANSQTSSRPPAVTRRGTAMTARVGG
jgi:hypothetical protein